MMTRFLATRAAVSAAAFLFPSAVFAQGCAMCYQTAAGSGSQFIQALRHGILIMFFPPVLIMTLIYYAAYRKRHKFNAAEGTGITKNTFGEDVPPEWSIDDGGSIRKLSENEK